MGSTNNKLLVKKDINRKTRIQKLLLNAKHKLIFTRCSYLFHDFFILFYNHNSSGTHSTVGCDFKDSRFCTNLCLLINNGDASKNRRILTLSLNPFCCEFVAYVFKDRSDPQKILRAS